MKNLILFLKNKFTLVNISAFTKQILIPLILWVCSFIWIVYNGYKENDLFHNVALLTLYAILFTTIYSVVNIGGYIKLFIFKQPKLVLTKVGSFYFKLNRYYDGSTLKPSDNFYLGMYKDYFFFWLKVESTSELGEINSIIDLEKYCNFL
jgi:hypothetical protein